MENRNRSFLSKVLSANRLKPTLFILIFAGLAIFLNGKSLEYNKVLASGNGYCPPDMTPEACLEYLQQQASQIQNELEDLENMIGDEEYAQLSLYGKIAYYNSIISSTQSSIDLLEIEIEQNNVEIEILGDEIVVIEENIYTASQEIVQLENALQKRISISYKYSSFSPLELMLNSDEFESLSRKIQYLKQTRDHDRDLLESMSEQVSKLTIEKQILAQKKLEVQDRQEENAAKKSELFDKRLALDTQKADQQILLAQSEQRQTEYESSLAQLQQVQDGVTAQITQLIFQLYQSGQIPVNTPVSAGDIIGLQGMTGLITGSHLHFEFRINGALTNPNNGCLSVSQGSYLGAGECSIPLDGGYVTQFPHTYIPSLWNAVDAVSMTGGEQPGGYVWGEAISCLGYYIPEGWRSTRGQGAFVRAVKDGMVSAVQTDVCGGRYVIIDHGDGEASLYLHMQ